MANSVSRRVAFVKVKKGQIKKRPAMDVNAGRSASAEGTEGQSESHTTYVVRPPAAPRSLWKMAWIPVLVLAVIGVFFKLAMGVGDNIRERSNVIDARTDRSSFDVRADRERPQVPEYDDRVSASYPEGRKNATDKSFLDTHYNGTRGGTTGGAATGNGGAPASSSASGKTQVARHDSPSCVLSYGGKADNFSQNLGDCLGKQK
jgi:hypothetical protein